MNKQDTLQRVAIATGPYGLGMAVIWGPVAKRPGDSEAMHAEAYLRCQGAQQVVSRQWSISMDGAQQVGAGMMVESLEAWVIEWMNHETWQVFPQAEPAYGREVFEAGIESWEKAAVQLLKSAPETARALFEYMCSEAKSSMLQEVSDAGNRIARLLTTALTENCLEETQGEPDENPGGRIEPGIGEVVEMPDGIPAPLTRAFDEEAYWRTFLVGEVRMGRLDGYKRVEDEVRVDETEGEASLIVPGQNDVPVNYGGQHIGPVYLLCFSELEEGNDGKELGFGPWAAQVVEPEKLGAEIWRAATDAIPGREPIRIELLRVRYNKGDFVEQELSRDERWRHMVAQKPKHFARECEWRFVLYFSGGVTGSPEHVHLELPAMERLVRPCPTTES